MRTVLDFNRIKQSSFGCIFAKQFDFIGTKLYQYQVIYLILSHSDRHSRQRGCKTSHCTLPDSQDTQQFKDANKWEKSSL